MFNLLGAETCGGDQEGQRPWTEAICACVTVFAIVTKTVMFKSTMRRRSCHESVLRFKKVRHLTWLSSFLRTSSSIFIFSLRTLLTRQKYYHFLNYVKSAYLWVHFSLKDIKKSKTPSVGEYVEKPELVYTDGGSRVNCQSYLESILLN